MLVIYKVFLAYKADQLLTYGVSFILTPNNVVSEGIENGNVQEQNMLNKINAYGCKKSNNGLNEL